MVHEDRQEGINLCGNSAFTSLIINKTKTKKKKSGIKTTNDQGVELRRGDRGSSSNDSKSNKSTDSRNPSLAGQLTACLGYL